MQDGKVGSRAFGILLTCGCLGGTLNEQLSAHSEHRASERISHARCRNLMVKQDLKELGFKATATAEDGTLSTRCDTLEPAAAYDKASPSKESAPADKKKQGFIAGLPR